MKRILPILFLSLTVAQALAVTNVGGTITGTTTFTKANSPYVVNTHLLVDEGATLIIEPGTEIRVDSAVNFFVEGTFRAVGTVTDPIVFKSNSTTPTRTSWQGVHVRLMGIVDSVIFDYCQFSSSAEAIRVDAAKLSVTHSTFIGCERAMLIYDMTGTSFAATDNIIKHGGYGVKAHATGILSANEFAHLDGAIESEDLDVIGNYVHDCGVGINLIVRGNQVANNKVVNVTNMAYMINDQSITPSSIHHNLSAYNGYGYGMGLFSSSFQHNTSIHDSIGIDLWDAVAPSVFKNNCIDSCKSYYVMISGAYDTDISDNYWGTTDTAVLQTRMFDYYDNFVARKGFILPALGQADLGCQSYTGPLVTSVTTTKAKTIAVTVSPNPFANSFIIDLHSQAITLEVFNMAGQKLLMMDATGKNKTEIDMSAYPAGIYHYRVHWADHTMAKGKLVKQQ